MKNSPILSQDNLPKAGQQIHSCLISRDNERNPTCSGQDRRRS